MSYAVSGPRRHPKDPASGQLIRVGAGTISSIGRGTQGVRIVRVDEGDQVVAAARIEESEEDEGSEGASAEAGPETEAS